MPSLEMTSERCAGPPLQQHQSWWQVAPHQAVGIDPSTLQPFNPLDSGPAGHARGAWR